MTYPSPIRRAIQWRLFWYLVIGPLALASVAASVAMGVKP